MQMLTRRPPGGSALAGLLLRKTPFAPSQAAQVSRHAEAGLAARSKTRLLAGAEVTKFKFLRLDLTPIAGHIISRVLPLV
jgi:hypothetical protein